MADLTFWQKVRIVEFNIAEAVLVFALLLSAVLVTPQVGSALTFVTALILLASIPAQDRQVKLKKILLTIALIMTVVLAIMKLVFVFSNMVKFDAKPTWSDMFGFKWNNQNKEVNLGKSFTIEIISFVFLQWYYMHL